ncbi:hypothetical protein ACIGDI_41850 [Streptomyces sp. NPDC085900]|uniref:hypothetical protein n=1 Tax=Streptomyces sp. NPDC085900 TaxID=3365737 RepID=UPI0037D94D7A
MDTFDHKVVEGFIQTMERNGIGLAVQANAFDKRKAILLDANRLGLFDDNPVTGVKPPQYDPKRVVIPSPEQLRQIRTAGDDSFRLVADLTAARTPQRGGVRPDGRTGGSGRRRRCRGRDRRYG